MTFWPSTYKQLKVNALLLGRKSLQFVDSVKYLGHYITNDLKDDMDIHNQLKQLCVRSSNMLIRNFNFCTAPVKSQLFQSFCTNIYGLALWSNYKVCSLNRIRVCYNNSFRYLHKLDRRCSASGMFVTSNVRSFGEVRRNLLYSFISSLKSHSNNLANPECWLCGSVSH